MDQNSGDMPHKVHWAPSVVSPPLKSAKVWQPEGSWIMLEEDQQDSMERSQMKTEQQQAYLHNQDEIDLAEISQELQNLTDGDSNLQILDASDRMEVAEMSLGLNVNLGVSQQELRKSTEVVKAMSISDRGHRDFPLEDMLDGQDSPFSRSSSCSLDDTSSNDEVSVPSISRAFSPGIWHDETTGMDIEQGDSSTLKYGGRAPPVLGALAPPVRCYGTNLTTPPLDYADVAPSNITHDSVDAIKRREHSNSPGMSWMDTGSILDHSSYQNATETTSFENNTIHESRDPSTKSYSIESLDSNALRVSMDSLDSNSMEKSTNSSMLENLSSLSLQSDVSENPRGLTCDNNNTRAESVLDESTEIKTATIGVDQIREHNVKQRKDTNEEKGTEFRHMVHPDATTEQDNEGALTADDTLPTESMVMVAQASELPVEGEENVDDKRETADDTSIETGDDTNTSVSSRESLNSESSSSNTKRSKSYRRRMKREKAKRRKAEAAVSQELPWHQALWQHSMSVTQSIGMKTVAPLVVSHVVTLLVGVYFGHRYFQQHSDTCIAENNSSKPTALRPIQTAVK